jgi:hypothetical protein
VKQRVIRQLNFSDATCKSKRVAFKDPNKRRIILFHVKFPRAPRVCSPFFPALHNIFSLKTNQIYKLACNNFYFQNESIVQIPNNLQMVFSHHADEKGCIGMSNSHQNLYNTISVSICRPFDFFTLNLTACLIQKIGANIIKSSHF